MGDRGNIVIRQSGTEPEEQVWLYTHWSGSELPSTLQEALKRRERWDDEPYLARIIFDQMTGLSGEPTGYGIGTGLGDNEHPILVVDCQKAMVEVWTERGRGLGKKLGEWSFVDYIALKDPIASVSAIDGEV